jgi:hypothetical protein
LTARRAFGKLAVMARKLRVQYPGAIYHVINRGDRCDAIFCEDSDWELFEETLGQACEKTDWKRCQSLHIAQTTLSAIC